MKYRVITAAFDVTGDVPTPVEFTSHDGKLFSGFAPGRGRW